MCTNSTEKFQYFIDWGLLSHLQALRACSMCKLENWTTGCFWSKSYIESVSLDCIYWLIIKCVAFCHLIDLLAFEAQMAPSGHRFCSHHSHLCFWTSRKKEEIGNINSNWKCFRQTRKLLKESIFLLGKFFMWTGWRNFLKMIQSAFEFRQCADGRLLTLERGLFDKTSNGWCSQGA